METGIKKPIKRSKELVSLSREHHDGLLLCWKIRTGLSKNVPFERITAYAVYFYNTFLKPHFEEEERYVFSLLPDNDAMKMQALSQHDRINQMIGEADSVKKMTEWLQNFTTELEQHIRYEERQLFNYIEEHADRSALENCGRILNELNSQVLKEEWTDTFWANKY